MKEMEIKIYAPVYIPTLNRYEHFKRCLESLERCTGADNTDVYIGLDYPPSEKYAEGWKLIDAYLAGKEKKNGFKNLFVRRRDHNCGVGKEGSNSSLLKQEIVERYDRYISSEDDNEFSPNFLEYINKGLELYKDDPRIMMISGYSYMDIAGMPFDSNVVAIRKAACWGSGYWLDKKFAHQILGSSEYRDLLLNSWSYAFRIFIKKSICVNSLLNMKFKKQAYGDGLICDYLMLENKYCVFPKLSKVRNWGHDGSGFHCSNHAVDTFASQDIDNSNTFDYDQLHFSSYLPVEYGYGDLEKKKWFKFLFPIFVSLRYIGYRLTNKDIMSYIIGYFKGKKTV